jgi:hypothetical protein
MTVIMLQHELLLLLIIIICGSSSSNSSSSSSSSSSSISRSGSSSSVAVVELGSSIGRGTRLRDVIRGIIFRFSGRQEIFPFSRVSRMAIGLTRPRIQSGNGRSLPRGKSVGM